MTNSNLTLEELKAQLATKKAERTAQIQTVIDTNRIMAEMRMIESPTYERMQIAAANNLILDGYLATIESVAPDALRHQYGNGEQLDKLLTILTSVLYSSKDVKPFVEHMLPISTQVIEDTLNAMGRLPYLDKTEMVVTEMQLPNQDVLIPNLEYIATELNLVNLNLTPLSDSVFNKKAEASKTKATKLLQDTLKYMDESDYKD